MPNGKEVKKELEAKIPVSEILDKYILELKPTKLYLCGPVVQSKINKYATFKGKEDGLDMFIYYKKPTPEEKVKAKGILVLGANCSGKTTLLNAIANFVLGVKLEDKFRYKIVHEK